MLTPWKESHDQPRQHIQKQRHHFVNKCLSSQGYGFSSGRVWMSELDYKESWVQKNWCFWTVVLEKILESPLDCKEIQPVHPKGDQSWVFIRRTDVEGETPVLWLSDAEGWLIWKDPDAGKDWGQEEKGTTEDEMVGWHHWLSGHGFGWTPGVGDGQWGLARCGSWGHDWATELNWTELSCLKRTKAKQNNFPITYRVNPGMPFVVNVCFLLCFAWGSFLDLRYKGSSYHTPCSERCLCHDLYKSPSDFIYVCAISFLTIPLIMTATQIYFIKMYIPSFVCILGK